MILSFSEILICITTAIFGIYFIFLSYLAIKWKSYEPFSTKSNLQNPISIIVAARNESQNISNLLKSLSQINYPKSKFEVVFVNDHSEDETSTICENLITSYQLENFRILELPHSSNGKKAAVAFGIAHSKNSIIATTDADCTVNPNWLQQISNAFENKECKFLSMPVALNSDETFFQKFQQVDFLFLNSIGGASMIANKPLMCNAANMAFYKDDFNEYNSKNSIDIASGDDMFLMLHIQKKYKDYQSCHFLKSENTIIKTNPQNTFKSLLHQRIRWTKKGIYYNSYFIKLIGVLVALLNILQILTYSLFTKNMWWFAIILLGSKLVAEFIYYKQANKLYKSNLSNSDFILAQIIEPLFMVVLLAKSFTSKIVWKNRVSRF